MFRVLLPVIILEYSFSVVEKNLSRQFISAEMQNTSEMANLTSYLKVEETQDQNQNSLDICVLITEDVPSFYKKIEKCKRNFFSADENKKFTLDFCNSVLGAINSNTDKSMKNNVLGPTFDRVLTKRSRDAKTNADTFGVIQKSEYVTLEKPLPEHLDEPKPPLKFSRIESNLELNMEEEWVEKDPKVSYKSHIYIGTSKFPLSFKTSRIINAKENVFSLLKNVQHQESSFSKSKVKKTVT